MRLHSYFSIEEKVMLVGYVGYFSKTILKKLIIF